jgi:hypothetical protein
LDLENKLLLTSSWDSDISIWKEKDKGETKQLKKSSHLSANNNKEKDKDKEKEKDIKEPVRSYRALRQIKNTHFKK